MNRIMVVACVLAVSLISPFARADEAPAASDSPPDYKKLYEEQLKRNNEIERRLSLVEQHDTQDLYVAKANVPESTLSFLKQTEISGFVSSSYTYNFNRPADRINAGRLYDWEHEEFMINKFTLVVQKPVEYDAFEWKAGYFAEIILGQDARSIQSKSPDTNTGFFNLGDNGDLEQAYILVNVPIGNGLKVFFGKYVTPMGYELVENEQNPNWSGGLQWTFIEPFTHTGLEFSYQINQQWDAQILINQGWDTVKDNNQSKSFMGRLGYVPNDNSSFTFIAYGGPEQSDVRNDPANGVPGANGNWRKGVELVATHKCSPQCNSAVQIDYGEEDHGGPAGDYAQWFGLGVWTTYDLSEKVQAAMRADYLADRDGGRTSGFLFPANRGQDLWSLTLTINVKPVEGLRFAPEIRYDHSSLGNAFDGHNDQVTAALGAVYAY